ncbi:VaFE repeat-containing surface-anchored protein [Breznakia pachnodae]|uniref:Uncharacterized protein n=1 Tax=Breznakia pachnodae TaxID=265178 RepID=A0ABU0DZT5_9FIRM|nr:VaFE repeat-containing surface-anchored protein [Breznakia pachnodae]MDQ0359993.1 hypothetical protein [Breznakia pachnodae]
MNKLKELWKNKHKILFPIFSLLMVFTSLVSNGDTKVKADEVVISYLTVPTGYTITYDNMPAPQTDMIFTSTNGVTYQVSFCANPGLFLHNGKVYYIDPNFYGEVDSGIGRIAYHGFYKKWGTNVTPAQAQANPQLRQDYANTYAMIYELAMGDGNVKNLGIDTGNYASFKAQVSSDVAKHDIRPSFHKQRFELYQGETITVTDSNGVFKDYKGTFPFTKNGVTYSKSGNDLIISASDTATSNDITNEQNIRKWDKTSNVNAVYRSKQGDSQDMFVGGYVDPVTVNFGTKIKIQGYAEFNKVDETDKLIAIAGTEVELFNSDRESLGMYVTDATGKVTTGLLDEGDYFFVERKAPHGYTLNPTEHHFTIANQKETVVVKIADKEVTGTTTLKKRDSETGMSNQGDADMSQSVYGLYKKDGTLVYKESVGSDLEITVEKLKLGGYYWQELSAGPGYKIDPKKYEFELTYKDQNTSVVVHATTSYEDVIKGKVALMKFSTNGEVGIPKPLKDVEFTFKLKKSVDDTSWEETPVAFVEKTNAIGYLETDLMAWGDYYVEETSTPKDHTPVERFVVSTKDGNENPYPILLNNPSFTSYLRFVKEHDGTVWTRDNATFQILDENMEVVKLWNGKEYIDTFTTDETGMTTTFTKLGYGDYYYSELVAPNGAIRIKDPVPFTITSTNENMEIEEGHFVTIINVNNEVPTGKIVDTKTFERLDETTKELKIAGFEYSYVGDGTNPVDGKPLYKDGDVIVNPNSEDGLYWLSENTPVEVEGIMIAENGTTVKRVEKVTPTGYVKSDDKLYNFTYENDEQLVYEDGETFENKLIRTDVEFTKKNEYTNDTVLEDGNVMTMYADADCTIELETFEFDSKLGTLQFKSIPFGVTRYFEETSANGNYYISDEVIAITFDENLENLGSVVQVDFTNVPKEKMGTTLTDLNGSKEVYANKTITLQDEVAYYNAEIGVEQKMSGQIMLAIDTGKVDENGDIIYKEKPLIINDEPVLAEVLFTPTEHDGKVLLTFTFDGTGLEGSRLVAYEDWTKDGITVAEHKDINDEGQTVTVAEPKIHTMASFDGKKEITADGKVTLQDKVSYENFIPNIEVEMNGVVMNKSTGKPFVVDGKEVIAKAVFTPAETNGTVILRFEFDAAGIDDLDLVVFEKAYANGDLIASEEDINNKDQTVKLIKPEIVETGDITNVQGLILLGIAGLLVIGIVTKKIKPRKKNDE